MKVNSQDVALAESLVRIAIETAAALKQLREAKPEVYAAIGHHHHDALAKAHAELAKP